jgi:hypothetical protein
MTSEFFHSTSSSLQGCKTPNNHCPRPLGPDVGMSQKDNPLPPPSSPPTPRCQRSHQSYLPCKEPTNTDDAQDIEHGRAHDCANSHVTFSDEDPWNIDPTSAWLWWPTCISSWVWGNLLWVLDCSQGLQETAKVGGSCLIYREETVA